jgi:phosphate/sulfate permease
MKQRRGTSLIESILNCVIGVGVATAGQIIIFPFFDIHVSLFDTGLIALIFTGISIVRSYALRRLFEYLRVTGMLP